MTLCQYRMKLLIGLITILFVSKSFSIPQNVKNGPNSNLSAQNDSVENSVDDFKKKNNSDLEERQYANIKHALKELNEI